MTESEIAEVRQEIQKHETERDATWRAFNYHDGQIFRLNCKLNAISPEECARITGLIGSKLEEKKNTPTKTSYKVNRLSGMEIWEGAVFTRQEEDV